MKSRPGLVTVVCLSTREPDPVCDYHMCLSRSNMPQLGRFQKCDSWVKGDMVYSVGFHRLNLIRLNKKGANGKRQYFQRRLGREMMKQVYGCVLHGLGIGHAAPHI